MAGTQPVCLLTPRPLPGELGIFGTAILLTSSLLSAGTAVASVAGQEVSVVLEERDGVLPVLHAAYSRVAATKMS